MLEVLKHPKSQVDELAKAIINELRSYHAGKWVVPPVALAKCPQHSILVALDVLDSLVENGTLARKFVKGGFPMYRWTPKTAFLRVIK